MIKDRQRIKKCNNFFLLIYAYIKNDYQHIKHVTMNKCLIGFQKKEAFNCKTFSY